MSNTAGAPGAAPSPTYKPHLDGIRAIAVAMVILFHLGYAWIPGGFVGVDVFFVLSGYLITGILLTEADRTGTVALRRFYARRARRLLPASIAVILVVMAVGAQVLDAIARDDLGRDALFAALYSANWRFATVGGDYFAAGDVPSPLVHFWSLAVEEQFYLVWPALFLVGLRRLGPRLIVVVGGVATASAVASVAFAGSPLTYYGTHTRAYQLLAGALLAMAVHERRRRASRRRATGRSLPPLVGPLLTAASLGVLGWLGHRITDASAYPGTWGLWVTAASVALIVGLDLCGPGPQQRILGAWPFAAVGRWSYSLYLWHWPVIVLLPVLADRWDRPGLDDHLAMVALTAVLAGVSYLAVERPIRFELAPAARPRRVAGVGVACSLTTAAIAYAAFPPPQGFEQVARNAVRDLAEPGPCPYFAEDWPAPTSSEPCLWRDGDGATVAIVGDSHAQQWQPALEVLAEPLDLRLVRLTRGGCPANDITVVINEESGQERVDAECTAWRRHTYPALVDRYDPDVVLVATRSHVREIASDTGGLSPSHPDHLDAWAEGWGWTLEALAAGGAAVVVSELLPTLPERIPACLLDHGPRTTSCDFPVAVDRDVPAYNEVIAALDGRGVPADARVAVVDPSSIACPDGICPAIDHGVIVHRDDNHLSATFVRQNADGLATLLRAAGVTL